MTAPLAPAVTIASGAVPEGEVADFLTGEHVRDTPEEYVRQNLEKALVRQDKYPAADCEPEVAIKVGSSRKRVDVIVFEPGAAHTQEHAFILVETKRAGTSPSNRTEGVAQLRSYMAACDGQRCESTAAISSDAWTAVHRPCTRRQAPTLSATRTPPGRSRP